MRVGTAGRGDVVQVFIERPSALAASTDTVDQGLPQRPISTVAERLASVRRVLEAEPPSTPVSVALRRASTPMPTALRAPASLLTSVARAAKAPADAPSIGLPASLEATLEATLPRLVTASGEWQALGTPRTLALSTDSLTQTPAAIQQVSPAIAGAASISALARKGADRVLLATVESRPTTIPRSAQLESSAGLRARHSIRPVSSTRPTITSAIDRSPTLLSAVASKGEALGLALAPAASLPARATAMADRVHRLADSGSSALGSARPSRAATGVETTLLSAEREAYEPAGAGRPIATIPRAATPTTPITAVERAALALAPELPSTPSSSVLRAERVAQAKGSLQWAAEATRQVREEAWNLVGEARRRGLPVSDGTAREWVSLAEEIAQTMPTAARAAEKALLPLMVRIESAAKQAEAVEAATAGAVDTLPRPAERRRAMRLPELLSDRHTVRLVDYHTTVSGAVGAGDGFARPALSALSPRPTRPVGQIDVAEAARVASTPPPRIGPTFREATQRNLRPTYGLFSPDTGRPRMASGWVEAARPQLAATLSTTLTASPYESAAGDIVDRVDGSALVRGAEPKSRVLRLAQATPEMLAAAPMPSISALQSEGLQALREEHLAVPGLRRAVIAQPGEERQAPRGEEMPTARPVSKTLSSLVARIFDEVPTTSLMMGAPSSRALSRLVSSAPDRIALSARSTAYRPTLADVHFDAPIFGLRSEEAKTRTAREAALASPRGPAGEVVDVAAAAERAARAMGGIARAAVQAHAVVPTTPTTTDEGAETRAAGAEARSAWKGLFDLASFSASASDGAAASDGTRPGFSSLPWLERELTRIVGSSPDMRWRERLAPRMRTSAAVAADAMLRQLDMDTEVEASDVDDGRFPGLPQAELPGAVVEALAGQTRTTPVRTGLGRAGRPARVTGVAMQGVAPPARDYVDTSVSSVPMPTSEPTAAPMARMSAQQLGQDHDRVTSSNQGGSAPMDQIEATAEQVYNIIAERLEQERDRYGR